MLALHTGPLRERRETFARWSSGGSPPQRPHSTNSGRRNVRRHACRSCTTRSRERVGATTYRCRSGIATVGPIGPVRVCSQERARTSRWKLARGTDESAETPRIAEPRTFSRRAEAKRSRPEPKLFSRKIATRGDGVGDRGVRGGARAHRSTGRKRPTPATSSHRSAHGVVKTPSAPVSRSCLGLASKKVEVGAEREETRSPHDTMGARSRIRG